MSAFAPTPLSPDNSLGASPLPEPVGADDADLVQLIAALDPYGKRVMRALLMSPVTLKAKAV